jgi:hypothetical protein
MTTSGDALVTRDPLQLSARPLLLFRANAVSPPKRHNFSSVNGFIN